MRIATWNVNGLRSRLDFVLHWLRERKPDVVGLQELKLTDEQFPHDAFEAAGFHAAPFGQKAWNGVAVLSRASAEVVQSGLPGQDASGARLLTVRVQGLRFTTVYVPNGKTVTHADFPGKLSWLDALFEHVAAGSPEDPAILCGDFNVCPAALDSWNEDTSRIFHTSGERERIQRLLDWGFVDVFRAIHPDRQAFSWWDYRGGAFHRGQGLRIDLMLATRPLMDRLVAIEIDRDYRKKKEGLTASDHAPVFADLD